MKIGDTATFIVTFTSEFAKLHNCEEPVEITFTFKAEESGAFPYGNQSATVMEWTWIDGTKNRRIFDTRYSRGDFEHVCNDILWDYCGDNIDEIDRVDVEQKFMIRFYNFSGKQIKQKTFKAFGWHDAEQKGQEFRKKFGLESADCQMNLLK